jgi:hypothetical protein
MDNTMIGDEHKRLCDPFREHGCTWVECLDCGAQWSVDEDGNPEEQIAEGDGLCFEVAVEEKRKGVK